MSVLQKAGSAFAVADDRGWIELGPPGGGFIVDGPALKHKGASARTLKSHGKAVCKEFTRWFGPLVVNPRTALPHMQCWHDGVTLSLSSEDELAEKRASMTKRSATFATQVGLVLRDSLRDSLTSRAGPARR